jgi:hypothetical protein
MLVHEAGAHTRVLSSQVGIATNLPAGPPSVRSVPELPSSARAADSRTRPRDEKIRSPCARRASMRDSHTDH